MQIIYRTVVVDLDTATTISTEDTAIVEVTDREIKSWVESGARPWECRMAAEQEPET